jgi:type I restriction enzyme S subunit
MRNVTETYVLGEIPAEFMVESGALLVGMDGDFNSSVWRGEPALLNQRCCKLSVVSTGYDPRFLAYCLPGYLAAINANTSAITVKHLSSRTISDIPLPLPPIAEQRRIADALDELFSDLDAGVAAAERVRAKLKIYRAAVLKAAVEGALVAEKPQLKGVPLRNLIEGLGQGVRNASLRENRDTMNGPSSKLPRCNP